MRDKVERFKEKRREAKALKEERKNRLPRITNETIAVHREEVLKGARKYIYPLQHSKHKVVIVTSSLFVAAIMAFSVYCVVSLYRLQSTSTFMYRVTQVIPFPIARTGGQFVAYENYLFELRHYMHYYENQQKLSFETESGRQQLSAYKKRALEKVETDARIKQIAREKGISVSDEEIDAQIELARNQNRLGGSTRVFEDVIREYYGWSMTDFRRSLRTQLLEEKVSAELDTSAKERADAALQALNSGTAFADVAKQFSDDEATKANGGEFGVIERSNTAADPNTIDTLFKLQANQFSQPIIIPYENGYAYEIIKNLEAAPDKAKGAHIIIRIADVNTFLNDRREQQPSRFYIRIQE